VQRAINNQGSVRRVPDLYRSAAGAAAFKMIEEVRRQFRDDPGIMEGTSDLGVKRRRRLGQREEVHRSWQSRWQGHRSS